MNGLILLILGVIILFAIIIVFFVYKSIKSIKNDKGSKGKSLGEILTDIRSFFQNPNNSENDSPEYFYYQRPTFYHTPDAPNDTTPSLYEDIEKALTILKSFAPPAFPFYDHKKWHSQEETHLRQYLKYVNIILREENLIVPVIQYIGDTDANCPGYTYNKSNAWIYIKKQFKHPSLQYQCYHIMIHEYMHHYLRVNNLGVEGNKDFDELLTDCAVIYFGFEDIYKLGRKWDQDYSKYTMGYIKNDSDLERLQLEVGILRDLHKEKMIEYWYYGNKDLWNHKS